MLALETGWTPDVIAGDTGVVSDEFRRACHWVIYAREMDKVIDSLDETLAIDEGDLTPTGKAQIVGLKLRAQENRALYHETLFPADEDDGG